jgi:hypothetical protein
MKTSFTRKEIPRTESRTELTRIQAYKKKINEINLFWKIHRKKITQSTQPADPQLIQKLGLKKREKILFFARSYGEWAKSIAKQTELTYTDATKEMIEHVKKSKGKIKNFKQILSEIIPQRPMIYDWSISYEPIPLITTNTLKISLTRSLLNRKGAKIIFSSIFKPSGKEALNQAIKISEIYGTKTEKKIIEIQTHLNGRKIPHTITIITLNTNPNARKKAFLDLRVLNTIDKEPTIKIDQLSKKFKVKSIEIINSMIRIEKLTTQNINGQKITLTKFAEWIKENL